MIIKEKEKELEYFKLAKNYFNSNPQEYEKSLEQLNKISLLIKNITIIHMKTLCLLMLSKYEDIIELYYLNRKHLDSLFNQSNIDNDNDNNEGEIIKEIKKIISIAFFNEGMKKKAKIICPDIKDEFQIEKSELEIKQNVNNLGEKEPTKINSNRINKENVLKNIKDNLDNNLSKKQLNENDLLNNINSSKDLVPMASEFVNDLFKSAMEGNRLLNMIDTPKIDEENYNENETDSYKGGFFEKNGTNISNKTKNSNIYEKLKS